jgi:hypothetical protein
MSRFRSAVWLAGTLALIAVTLSAACGGTAGKETGDLYFHASSGEAHLSGAASLDTTFAKLRGDEGALYHAATPARLVIPLESADGGITLTTDVVGITGPGTYTSPNAVEAPPRRRARAGNGQRPRASTCA